ncbi:MAG: ATP-binding cassette domain-containing protein [bacterium]|nr:ATP-binding cassette domain-containing protein [bacterium]
MISIENLSKNYGSFKAVDAISFQVERGEVVGFLGPNGAGKTTTMKMITCYMPPTTGRIVVDGLDVVEQSLEVRRKIGYMPESAPLYHDLNLVDYLRLAAEFRGIAKDQRERRVREMVEVCALGEMVQKRVGELSKGFRQRVCLAQALIHDPEILILDEPTVGLDPNQIIEIRSLIKQLGQRKTVILSTHILPEVEATCDRVVIIHRGKIVADGATNDVVAQFSGQGLVTVEFALPVPDATGMLRQLPRVGTVREVGAVPGGGWQLRVEAREGADVRNEIFRIAAQNDWPLTELRKEGASLETVFQSLTRDDAAKAA